MSDLEKIMDEAYTKAQKNIREAKEVIQELRKGPDNPIINAVIASLERYIEEKIALFN